MSGSYGLRLKLIYALYATIILNLVLELLILLYQIITGYALYAVTSLYMKQLQISYNCVNEFLFGKTPKNMLLNFIFGHWIRWKSLQNSIFELAAYQNIRIATLPASLSDGIL